MACPLCAGSGVVARGLHDHYKPVIQRENKHPCDRCGTPADDPAEHRGRPGGRAVAGRAVLPRRALVLRQVLPRGARLRRLRVAHPARGASPTTSRRSTPIDGRLAELRRAVADPLPHPSPDELRAAAAAIQDWALRHHETLPRPADRPDRHAGRDGRLAATGRRRTTGRPFADVLAEFGDHVEPFAFRVNHPRFLAFIPGAPCFPSVLGDWLCAGSQLLRRRLAGGGRAGAGRDRRARLVPRFLGLCPPTARGILTGGGSEANLTALVVARERLPFDDRDRAVLYVAEQRHWSVDRAAKVIGLHPEQIRPVPVDADFRLTAGSLTRLVRQDRGAGRLPWAVVANAGATNTGTVDPWPSWPAVCRARGCGCTSMPPTAGRRC